MRTMNPRILVVDDDTALAEMIGIVLRTEGFEPVFCADGAAAVDAFRSSNPDLVLLDLMLPGLDGIEVCARIREESGTPIIMLTAKGDAADVGERAAQTVVVRVAAGREHAAGDAASRATEHAQHDRVPWRGEVRADLQIQMARP